MTTALTGRTTERNEISSRRNVRPRTTAKIFGKSWRRTLRKS